MKLSQQMKFVNELKKETNRCQVRQETEPRPRVTRNRSLGSGAVSSETSSSARRSVTNTCDAVVLLGPTSTVLMLYYWEM